MSTWSDVSAALGSPALSIRADLPSLPSADPEFDHRQLDRWRREIDDTAAELAARLTPAEPIDLMAVYAKPWSLWVAALLAGVDQTTAAALTPLARVVFEAAAHATGPLSDPRAEGAASQLALRLPPSALGVQTFVALSHTLPHLLAAAWLALLEHPDEWLRLRNEPQILPQAVEELLRFATPSRTVFRVALTPLVIGGVSIAKGDELHLRLDLANRDPARFPEPDRLDLTRGQAGHLAFGRGKHACAGAQLIRIAVAAATSALLEATATIKLAGDPVWLDGPAIRAPATLPVRIERSQPL